MVLGERRVNVSQRDVRDIRAKSYVPDAREGVWDVYCYNSLLWVYMYISTTMFI